ncbi:hypothetical protein A1OO_19385 [Enterovibrio norvegicus FF-33]|uniref:Uncharacterized protein n=1 Tax=Enterovibrio norvegicus FF-454 TaxID=1185651 RepID=A0A1E5C0A2_9GAMM|nr:hypothetical protein [Enterovibrio norvegicus]OEE58944.1 hypothetical protein A1OK_02755 [Enterovibrio norvegicus FF-454]OEE67902.1 hypothetical protein A1OO_19385 [Enterovibrio norvegicus FF-33]OEE73979.1 hypothetical protein A1OQ_10205 [Enterovibrio norvegicus FF-162]
MNKKVSFFLLLLFSSTAIAERQSGQITGYIPYTNDGKKIIIFQITSNVSGGCNTTGRFAVDSLSPIYEGTISAVIAAHHAQSPVTIIYTQSCKAWDNSWDAQGVCVGNIPC